MRPEKTLSANTINNILTNISSFLTWCVGEGLLDANPAQHLKIKDDTPETDFKAPFTRNDL